MTTLLSFKKFLPCFITRPFSSTKTLCPAPLEDSEELIGRTRTATLTLFMVANFMTQSERMSELTVSVLNVHKKKKCVCISCCERTSTVATKRLSNNTTHDYLLVINAGIYLCTIKMNRTELKFVAITNEIRVVYIGVKWCIINDGTNVLVVVYRN